MKRFFTKTGIWLLAAAATIAVVLCVVSALSSGTGLLHNALPGGGFRRGGLGRRH